jgi:streptogrisin C
MRIHKLGGACLAIAALVAMALAASAHANAQSSNASDLSIASAALAPQSLDPVTNAQVAAVASPGIPLPRAREAIAVQGAVEQNGLVGELEAALGEAFGGVWYEPAAAQLNVGVTSPEAARNAEAVAVRAGLGMHVTEIPVHSSEAELVAAQKRWSRRLDDLFERKEVSSAISTEDNAVVIELGSEVPRAELSAIEDQASDAGVNVSVARVSAPKLQLINEARCRKFESSKAFCDPTIVGGTSLEDSGATKEPQCTVGPAVAQLKGSTELYVLTAGHCIKAAGESFFTLNKEGTKTEEIGKVAAFLSEAAGNNADVAAIKVEKEPWKKAGETPITPAIAPWDKTKEVEPFIVKGENKPAQKAMSCISGQTTGFQCGMILNTAVKVGKLEKLVEVGTVVTGGGDSGAPWFSEAGKLVEGTHVGKHPVTKNSVFQELQFSFQRFKEVSKLELELLTEGNQKRM